MDPGSAIVFDAVAFIEWGVIGYVLALVEFAFGNGMGVCFTCFHVADAFPVGAIDAYADEAFAAGEYDIAFGVVPGVVFILL